MADEEHIAEEHIAYELGKAREELRRIERRLQRAEAWLNPFEGGPRRPSLGPQSPDEARQMIEDLERWLRERDES